MQKVNANQLVHSGSPYFMGTALQSWTITRETLVSGVYGLGLVLSKPKKGLVSADARIVTPFAEGESVDLTIVAIRENGTRVPLGFVTLDDSFASGTFDLLGLAHDPLPVAAGDILHIEVSYTAGGTPAAPLIALLFQVG